MHSTTIEPRDDGTFGVACSCGVDLGAAPSRIAAEAYSLAHVAGATGSDLTELAAVGTVENCRDCGLPFKVYAVAVPPSGELVAADRCRACNDDVPERSPVESLKAEAHRKAGEIINDFPSWTGWSYEVMHGVVASAYCAGRADGFRECMEIVTTPYTPDPRD